MTTGAPPPAAPKRSRARRIVPLGIALWLVLEIWLLTVVAGATNGLTVLLLLIGAGILGSVVVKRAGRRAFRNLTETLQQAQRQQQNPDAGTSDESAGTSSGNGFLMLGGLLIMLPGLISDAVGLVLLVPPVRSALSRKAERSLERRMRDAGPGGLGDAYQQAQQARMSRPDGKVVQGEVIRHDEPRPPGGSDHDGPRPPLTH
ncbi:FxsA family protein [Streptomyces sp. NBC_01725]|uniref:FxsA family membrane protein n=1 Tax=unclassified Streptomyces TaxID=2593676 RepID=UPI0011C72B29|nr:MULTISPECIES: FxsA family membrane protein [unclassified Streptomyces]TXL85966.1 FxsA family protein [Streptomyces sp. IB2014 016-6]